MGKRKLSANEKAFCGAFALVGICLAWVSVGFFVWFVAQQSLGFGFFFGGMALVGFAFMLESLLSFVSDD